MIICDTCKINVTIDNSGEIPNYEIVKFGHSDKKCFCHDCMNTLLEFAGSKEHLQKTKEYLKEMEQELGEPVDVVGNTDLKLGELD